MASRFAAGVAAGLACGLLVAVLAPLPLGGRTFTVMSGSMEPTLHTGDAIVDTRTRATDLRVGDVVTFKDPSRSGRLVTHRVRSVEVRGGRVRVVTKGDANNTVERWSVPASGHVGRVRYRIWRLGYALAPLHTRIGLLALVALPAVALCVLELVSIWRPPAPREHAA